MTKYNVIHHRNFNCGHNHDTIAQVFKCYRKQLKRTEYTCCECGSKRIGYRVAKCRECKHGESYGTPVADKDYYRMVAITQDGDHRPLNSTELHEISCITHNKEYVCPTTNTHG
jgi:hypothetical protein